MGNRNDTSLAIDEFDNRRTRVDGIVPLFKVGVPPLAVADVDWNVFTVVLIGFPGVDVDVGRCGEFCGVSIIQK